MSYHKRLHNMPGMPLLMKAMQCIYTKYVKLLENIKIFIQAVETGGKASLWWDYLACFKDSANEFDVHRQFTYIVFMLQYQKV